jgi:hypothetical protein
MNLTELRKLAEAATSDPTNEYSPWCVCVNCEFRRACTRKYVLALLDCVEAADAMREAYSGRIAYCAYDAARARLEAKE